ncbi:hypothetical protein D3C73_1263760 [compost metagenome]
MLHHLVHQCFIRRSLRSPGTAFIVGLPPPAQQIYRLVNDHVAGAGIKSKYSFRSRSRRQRRAVANPADVLEQPALLRMTEQNQVAVRGQRRPLPADRHVGRAEITDHKPPGLLSQDGQVAKLQRGSHQMGISRIALRNMPYRLAVGADQVNLLRLHTGAAYSFKRGFSKFFGQIHIHAADRIH